MMNEDDQGNIGNLFDFAHEEYDDDHPVASSSEQPVKVKTEPVDETDLSAGMAGQYTSYDSSEYPDDDYNNQTPMGEFFKDFSDQNFQPENYEQLPSDDEMTGRKEVGTENSDVPTSKTRSTRGKKVEAAKSSSSSVKVRVPDPTAKSNAPPVKHNAKKSLKGKTKPAPKPASKPVANSTRNSRKRKEPSAKESEGRKVPEYNAAEIPPFQQNVQQNEDNFSPPNSSPPPDFNDDSALSKRRMSEYFSNQLDGDPFSSDVESVLSSQNARDGFNQEIGEWFHELGSHYFQEVCNWSDENLQSLQNSLFAMFMRQHVRQETFHLPKQLHNRMGKSNSIPFTRYTFKDDSEVSVGNREQAEEYEHDMFNAEMQRQLEEQKSVPFNKSQLTKQIIEDIKGFIDDKKCKDRLADELRRLSSDLKSIKANLHLRRLLCLLRHGILFTIDKQLKLHQWMKGTCFIFEKDDNLNICIENLSVLPDGIKNQSDGLVLQSPNLRNPVIFQVVQSKIGLIPSVRQIGQFSSSKQGLIVKVRILEEEKERRGEDEEEYLELTDKDYISSLFKSQLDSNHFHCQVVLVPGLMKTINMGASLIRDHSKPLFKELITPELSIIPNFTESFDIHRHDFKYLSNEFSRRAIFWVLAGITSSKGSNLLVVDCSSTEMIGEISVSNSLFYLIVKYLLVWKHKFKLSDCKSNNRTETDNSLKKDFIKKFEEKVKCSLVRSECPENYATDKSNIPNNLKILIIATDEEVIQIIKNLLAISDEKYYYSAKPSSDVIDLALTYNDESDEMNNLKKLEPINESTRQDKSKLAQTILSSIYQNCNCCLGTLENILMDETISDTMAEFDICVLSGVENLTDAEIASLIRFKIKKIVMLCDSTFKNSINSELEYQNVAFKMVEKYKDLYLNIEHEIDSSVISSTHRVKHKKEETSPRKPSTSPNQNPSSSSSWTNDERNFSTRTPPSTRKFHGRHSPQRGNHRARGRGHHQRSSSFNAHFSDYRIPKRDRRH